MIGTVLGNRYKLIAELGSGGMAWVYLAEDLIQGGKVAVKILYPQHSKDLRFVQRFNREARLSMSLSQSASHTNVVCVLDYGADRDTHYLVMEYVPGQDLGQLLEQQGPLPWQEALAIARQVALALSHAHELDIVHRDIKPSNIMVLSDGTTRVLDFGIARVRTSPQLTLEGFVGSPHYAAPEQAQGEEVDIRADIYSLGIVTYRMLSGDLPFQGDTPWAVVNQHLIAEPPPLADICPELPKPVTSLVQKAMARKPEDRFQTPDELVRAIDAVLPARARTKDPGPAPPVLDLATIYERAQLAGQRRQWQEAIELYSQILKADPGYRDALQHLDAAAQQVRLITLYRSVQRALEVGQWDHALSLLDEITAIEPGYRDTEELRVRAVRGELTPEGDGAAGHEFPTYVPTTSGQPEMPQVGLSSERELGADGAQPKAGHTRRRYLLLLGAPILALVLAAAGYLIFSSAQQPTPTPTFEPRPSPTHTAQVTLPASVAGTITPGTTVAKVHTGLTTTPEVSVPTATATPSPTPTHTLQAPSATASRTASPTLSPTPTSTSLPIATPRPRLSGQIAFPRFDPNRGLYDIYTCQVDGSNCRLVYAGASQPDFLPGGNRLVVHVWRPTENGLALISRTGELIWRITDEVEAARPSVDFQGNLYVYHSRMESDRKPRLYRTYGAETGPILRDASTVLGQSPSWLPDGRILYSGCWQDDCGILVTRADGTHPGQIAAGANETNPEASPAGNRVAFMSLRDGNWEIYLANMNGGSATRLTSNPANDGLPVWSPDGRYIAFVTDREGEWAVWVMRPDGTSQRRLFDIGGPLDGQVRDAALHESHGWVEERISWASPP